MLDNTRVQFTVKFHIEEVGYVFYFIFQESSENLKTYSYTDKENVWKSFYWITRGGEIGKSTGVHFSCKPSWKNNGGTLKKDHLEKFHNGKPQD